MSETSVHFSLCSAQKKRGLIETGERGRVGEALPGVPRKKSAASLRHGGRLHKELLHRQCSAQKKRGLIETIFGPFCRHLLPAPSKEEIYLRLPDLYLYDDLHDFFHSSSSILCPSAMKRKVAAASLRLRIKLV